MKKLPANKKSKTNTKSEKLEKLHSRLFSSNPTVISFDSADSLEQPDFMVVVPSVTTQDLRSGTIPAKTQ